MKYYTGVGSRSTPKDIQQLMTKIAYKLADKGYILRSGAAQGADTAFEQGCIEYWQDSELDWPPMLANIYIPWQSFMTYPEEFKDWYSVLDRLPNNKQAYTIAETVHPAWDRCSRGAKALHARNVYQVLGEGLNNPSDFLICWAETDKHGEIKGGTRTAWELAKSNGVRYLFNLYNQDDKQRLMRFVE